MDGGAEGRRGCRCDRLVTSFQGLSGQILSNMKPSTASHAAFGLISKSASLRGGGTESRSDMRRGSLRYDVGPAWKAIFGAMLAPGRPRSAKARSNDLAEGSTDGREELALAPNSSEVILISTTPTLVSGG